MKRIIPLMILIAVTSLKLFAFEGDPYRVFIKTDRLSFEAGNTAEIYLCVQNTGEKNIFFKVFPVPYSTFQPVVYTMDGTEEQTKVKYRLANRNVDAVVAPLVPREVEIAPNETFYHKVNLADFYNLVPGAKYRIRGFFMPDARMAMVVRSENSLEIKINAPMERIDVPVQIARKSSINPAEIVGLYLKAEKDGRWSDVLKYLYVEKYINNYPDYSMSFNSAGEVQRRSILRDFITYLSKPRNDYILDFDVAEEKIIDGGLNALVTATVKRHGAVNPQVYECRYTLEKYGNLWRISSSEATMKRNKGR